MLTTKEGAEYAVSESIDWLEETLQEHGHKDFKIADKKKEVGLNRLSPVVQKYAPEMLGLLGQYKKEFFAALWLGTLSYSSVKEIKSLKKRDAIALKAKAEGETTTETAKEAA